MLPGSMFPADHFLPFEMPCAERRVDPLAIMQVQNGGGRNRRARFGLLAVEGRGDEHSHPHHSRVSDFDPDLCRADIRIEYRQNVVDPAFEDLLGIRVQPDIGELADMHRIEIVFVNVADDPDIRKIGDSEWIRGSQSLDARRVRNLLISDYARDRGHYVDNSRGMVLVDAEKSQLLVDGIQIGLRILLRSSACSRALFATAPFS